MARTRTNSTLKVTQDEDTITLTRAELRDVIAAEVSKALGNRKPVNDTPKAKVNPFAGFSQDDRRKLATKHGKPVGMTISEWAEEDEEGYEAFVKAARKLGVPATNRYLNF